jgi:class 3 adenylate cyclase
MPLAKLDSRVSHVRLGTTQTSRSNFTRSAYPSKADGRSHSSEVRLVPRTDSCPVAIRFASTTNSLICSDSGSLFLQQEQRRLAAILAADVAGYSRLMAADESGTLARLRRLRTEAIEPKIAQFHGRIVGSAGDSLLVEFASALNAVQCAVEVQVGLAD